MNEEEKTPSERCCLLLLFVVKNSLSRLFSRSIFFSFPFAFLMTVFFDCFFSSLFERLLLHSFLSFLSLSFSLFLSLSCSLLHNKNTINIKWSGIEQSLSKPGRLDR
jgi:hypothetical protein